MYRVQRVFWCGEPGGDVLVISPKNKHKSCAKIYLKTFSLELNFRLITTIYIILHSYHYRNLHDKNPAAGRRLQAFKRSDGSSAAVRRTMVVRFPRFGPASTREKTCAFLADSRKINANGGYHDRDYETALVAGSTAQHSRSNDEDWLSRVRVGDAVTRSRGMGPPQPAAAAARSARRRFPPHSTPGD